MQAKSPTPDGSRFLYNLLYRLTGSRQVAKRLAAKVVEGGWPATPLDLRFRLLTVLGPEESGLCLIRRARDILASVPTLPGDLPDPVREPAAFERELKEALAAPYLALIELMFVERWASCDLAQLLGVGEQLLVSFIVNLLDQLTHATGREHPRGCPHPARVLGEVVRTRRIVPGLECPVCIHMVPTVLAIFQVLGRDSRILSFSDPDFIRKALRAPRPWIGPPRRRSRPTPASLILDGPPALEPKAEDGAAISNPWGAGSTGNLAMAELGMRSSVVRRVAIPLVCVPGLILVAAALWPRDAAPREGDSDLTGVAAGIAHLSGSVMGTISDGHGPVRPLLAMTTVKAAADRPMTLSLHSGMDVVVWPSGQATVAPGQIEVLAGKVRVRQAGATEAVVQVKAGDLVGRMQDADVLIGVERDEPMRFHVRRGRVAVRDAVARRYLIGQGDLLRVAPTGSGYGIEAAPVTDIAFQPPSPDADLQLQ